VGRRELWESGQELRARVEKLKLMLQKYGEKYSKIAVVSHSWTLRYLLTTEFDSSHYPLSMPVVENAKPILLQLSKLLCRL